MLPFLFYKLVGNSQPLEWKTHPEDLAKPVVQSTLHYKIFATENQCLCNHGGKKLPRALGGQFFLFA